MSVSTLVAINEARLQLQSVNTLDDVLAIRDKAEALRVYAKAALDSLETANAAAEIKLRAERRAGEMLSVMEKRDGGDAMKARSHVDTELPPSLAELGIDKNKSSRWQREAAVDDDTFEQYLLMCREDGREVTQSGLLQVANGAHVGNNSGNSEWYTPQAYVDAVRQAMGGIDVDPCSCNAANSVVQADTFYDQAEDGLRHEWRGRVFVNPPYGDGTVDSFASKLVEEILAGSTTQAVFLVNNCTETKWFQSLISEASAVCFPRGRISFWSLEHKSKSPLQGQAVMYFGCESKRFVSAFSGIGFCTLIR